MLPRALALLLIAGICGLPLFGQLPADYLTEARSLTESLRWREAIELLRRGLWSFPHDVELLFQLGSLLHRTGDPEGERTLTNALSLAPDRLDIRRSLADARINSGAFESAILLLEECVTTDPRDSSSLYLLAYVLLLRGDDEAALRHSHQAATISPGDSRVKRLYALLLAMKGKREESVQQLSDALKANPASAELLFQLSEAKRHEGKQFQRLEYLEMAAQLDPENPLYADSLSRLYRELNQEAQARLEESKSQLLREVFSAYTQSLRMRKEGRILEAIDTLRNATAQCPYFVTGFQQLGSLYEALGWDRQALEQYLQVIQLDPANRQATAGLPGCI